MIFYVRGIVIVAYFWSEQLEATPPAPPPGISLDEEVELRADMERLEEDLAETMSQLTASQDKTKKLSES